MPATRATIDIRATLGLPGQVVAEPDVQIVHDYFERHDIAPRRNIGRVHRVSSLIGKHADSTTAFVTGVLSPF
jgi:hypothetical protein